MTPSTEPGNQTDGGEDSDAPNRPSRLLPLSPLSPLSTLSTLSRRQFVEGALKLGVTGFTATGAAGLLAACHSKKKAAAPKKLTGRVQILIGFDGGNTAAQRQVQQTLAQAFIAAHPQVGIDFLRATSATAAETQLRTLVSRGSAPDIVLGIGQANLSRLADQHMWLDLRPLFRRDGVSTNSFSTQATSAAALSSYYGGTKAIPGVPVAVQNHALAYNVDLFSKAGLPAPPASWSDNSWAYPASFLQAAQTLTVDQAGKHSGQAGFDPIQIVQFGVARIPAEYLFFSFGGHFYNVSKKKAEFDMPAAIQGAQFAGDLLGKYHVQPSAAELAKLAGPENNGNEEQAAWRAGKLAMIDLCSCEIDSPFGTKVPFAWKAAALPAGPGGRFGPLEVNAGAIVVAGTQHDLAWEVLKSFAVDPGHERQLAYGGFGAMPALTANTDAFAAGTKQVAGVDPAVWLAGLPNASTEAATWIPAFADVHSLFKTAVDKIAGGASAATVMPQLQADAQAKIDAWFKVNKLPH
jgi:multiple sugar transport system substrate-binding protein